MKTGIVISGGDVSGMNNFTFQVTRQANVDIMLFNDGIPGLLEKSHQNMAWHGLVDFFVTAVLIVVSGRANRKLQRSKYENIVRKLKSLRIDVLIMTGRDDSLQLLDTLSELEINCFDVGVTIDSDVYGSDYTIGFSAAHK